MFTEYQMGPKGKEWGAETEGGDETAYLEALENAIKEIKDEINKRGFSGMARDNAEHFLAMAKGKACEFPDILKDKIHNLKEEDIAEAIAYLAASLVVYENITLPKPQTPEEMFLRVLPAIPALIALKMADRARRDNLNKKQRQGSGQPAGAPV